MGLHARWLTSYINAIPLFAPADDVVHQTVLRYAAVLSPPLGT